MYINTGANIVEMLKTLLYDLTFYPIAQSSSTLLF